MDATATRRLLCAEPAHPPLSVIDAAAGLAPAFDIRPDLCLYATVPMPAPQPVVCLFSGPTARPLAQTCTRIIV